MSRFFLALFLSAVWLSAIASCRPATSAEKDLVVKIADDVCKDVTPAAGVDPEWIELLCGAGSEAVKVLLPRQEWHAMQARRAGVVDAGPGK
jgi:hypothetical protein